MQLADVLAGYAARTGEPQDQPVVELLAALRIAHLDMPRGPRPWEATAHRLQCGRGLRPREANDRDCRAARSSRRRVNRLSLVQNLRRLLRHRSPRGGAILSCGFLSASAAI